MLSLSVKKRQAKVVKIFEFAIKKKWMERLIPIYVIEEGKLLPHDYEKKDLTVSILFIIFSWRFVSAL